MDKTNMTIEDCRTFWSKIARENGWYVEPFYVHVWIDGDGVIIDSVSHRDMTQDVVIEQ